MRCPNCKTEDKITLIDHQSLACSYHEDEAKKDGYFLEGSITADAKCWECGHKFTLEGDINWNRE